MEEDEEEKEVASKQTESRVKIGTLATSSDFYPSCIVWIKGCLIK